MKKIMLINAMLIPFLMSGTLFFFSNLNDKGLIPASAEIDSGIWYVSTAGNDGGSCSTTTDPCATINAAIGKAVTGDTIYVEVGKYSIASGNEVVLVDKSVALSGGWDSTFTVQKGISIVDGQNTRRGITISSGSTVTITSFSFQNGNNGIAAGLFNAGSLTIQNSYIRDNTSGRGMINDYGAVMTMIGCTVSGNYVADQGGGIWNFSELTLIRTVVKGNTATSVGGGIHSVSGRLTLINSIVSDNTSAGGGAMDVGSSSELRLYNSTIINNSATYWSGGVACISCNIIIQNTIIADNHAGQNMGAEQDCTGSISSSGYNLIGNTAGCSFAPTTGDILNASPQTVPLGNYYALLSTSPAIDAGNPDGCNDDLGNPIVDDQRGSPRPMDGNNDGISRCDIGAYELDPNNPVRQLFLPVVVRAPVGLTGFVTMNGTPAPGAPLDLRFYDADN